MTYLGLVKLDEARSFCARRVAARWSRRESGARDYRQRPMKHASGQDLTSSMCAARHADDKDMACAGR